MTNLDGTVVVVAGASGGLGSRIAALLEASGAIVVRPSRAELAGAIESTVAQHGKLDGLVIATGVVAFGAAAELQDATVATLFEVNAIDPITLIVASQPHLAKSAAEGREPFIITLSGVVAEAPVAGLAAYSASKAALAAFVTATAREYRRSGIRVMDARPGHTATDLSQHPIAGTAPAFGAALDPDAVAARIVRGIVDGEKDLPSSAFTA
jgi:short-subunit dehydrogenase